MLFRFLFLFLIFICALFGAYSIVMHLQRQSTNTFYGSAETDYRVINLEFPAIVQQLLVAPGTLVKQGDTLAILHRAEFERKTLGEQGEIKQLSTQLEAEISSIDKEKALVYSKSATTISELEAEIKVLKTENANQQSLKNLVGNTGSSQQTNINNTQIASLEESIALERKQQELDISLLDNKIQSAKTIYQTQVVPYQQNIGFLASDKNKLILLAPISGYVEAIFVGKNEMVQSYREIIKISALKPVRVICFLHESEKDVPIQPGDTVSLSSTSRPSITSKGVVSGSTPKLIELPTRLRKFAEIKTWGREMFVHIPADNPFYIGEKILIELK